MCSGLKALKGWRRPSELAARLQGPTLSLWDSELEDQDGEALRADILPTGPSHPFPVFLDSFNLGHTYRVRKLTLQALNWSANGTDIH